MADFPHRRCHTRSVTVEPVHSQNSFYYPQIIYIYIYITKLKIISSIMHRYFSTFLLLFYLLCHSGSYSQNIQEGKCTYKHNSETHSRNHGCRAKARVITYSECVCLCVCVCVCICSLSCTECKTHALCYIVVCVPSGSTTFFPLYLINGTVFIKTF